MGITSVAVSTLAFLSMVTLSVLLRGAVDSLLVEDLEDSGLTDLRLLVAHSGWGCGFGFVIDSFLSTLSNVGSVVRWTKGLRIREVFSEVSFAKPKLLRAN